ncbi:hypothetical protein ACLMYS_003896 [Salmonella enterica]
MIPEFLNNIDRQLNRMSRKELIFVLVLSVLLGFVVGCIVGKIIF